MKPLYQTQLVRRNMTIEYLLYQVDTWYIIEVKKYESEITEASSYPINTDEKEALRLTKALKKSRVTPCSLHDAMNDRDVKQ